MPRKTSLPSKDSDPIYSISRWGPKKPETAEIPVVERSGGRIKKAKTIFDPSDSWKSVAAPVDPRPDHKKKPTTEKRVSEPEKKKPEKRRLSESTTVSRASSGTSATVDVVPKPTNDHKKKIKLDSPAAAPAAAAAPPQPPAEAKAVGRRHRPSKVKDHVTGSSTPSKPVAGEVITYRLCKKCLDSFPSPSEDWTSCGMCRAPMHKSCFEHAKGRGGRYLCDKCNICTVCTGPLLVGGDQQTATMTCSGEECSKACHYTCASQNGTKNRTPSRKWRCNNCTEVEILALKDEASTDDDSEAAFEGFDNNGAATEDKASHKLALHGDIPDAKNWTSKDVYNYFAKQFPNEAPNFQQQEIDGLSLLLMRRSDVIRGMGFRLGPALRIYKHIVMLQTRDPDPTLTWY